jgi:hypothetical protein
MAKMSANTDNRVADLLLELKRHLRTCRNCQGATKTRDSSALCDHTTGLVLSIVIRYDRVIANRITAKNSGDPHVFACPDLGAHGKTYPLIAESLLVTAVQDALF